MDDMRSQSVVRHDMMQADMRSKCVVAIRILHFESSILEDSSVGGVENEHEIQ